MLYPLSYEGRAMEDTGVGRTRAAVASVARVVEEHDPSGDGAVARRPRTRRRSPPQAAGMQRRGQRDGVGVRRARLGTRFDQPLVAECGQGDDDPLEVRDARFQVGAVGDGGNVPISMRLHDDWIDRASVGLERFRTSPAIGRRPAPVPSTVDGLSA